MNLMSPMKTDDTRIRTTIRLEGPAVEGDGPSLQALGTLAGVVVEIAQRALRLRIEGRADLRRKPEWLVEATEIRLTRVEAGSIIVEAPALIGLSSALPTAPSDGRLVSR